MINKRTLLVLGAGASAELRFPIGSGLMDRIRNLLDLSKKPKLGEPLRDIRAEIYHACDTDESSFSQACSRIVKLCNTFGSIDEVLNYLPGDDLFVKVGKLAIAQVICEAEQGSALINESLGPAADVNAARDTWMPTFFKLCMSASRKDSIRAAFENLSIVNFNYDRSLEHYLFHFMQQHALLSEDESAAFVAGLNIIRPYGTIGTLPFLKEGATTLQYGFKSELSKMAASLRTYTEPASDAIKARIHDAVASSIVVIILGFGFAAQNVSLLLTRQKSYRRVIATGYGMDARNYQGLTKVLHETLAAHIADRYIDVHPDNCTNLLRNLYPAISAAVS